MITDDPLQFSWFYIVILKYFPKSRNPRLFIDTNYANNTTGHNANAPFAYTVNIYKINIENVTERLI